jgi:hypothetical protein
MQARLLPLAPSCPRQPSVPSCVHKRPVQDVWLPAYWRQLRAGSQLRQLSPHTSGARGEGGRPGLIGSAGSRPNPFASSQLPPVLRRLAEGASQIEWHLIP